eukprot:gene286-278_t
MYGEKRSLVLVGAAGVIWHSAVAVFLRGDDGKDGKDNQSPVFAKFVESNDATQVRTALSLMMKIIENILANENNRKYRKIKKSSKGFNTKILSLSGGAQVMAEMGFKENNNSFVNEYPISVLTKHQDRIAEAIVSLETKSRVPSDGYAIPNQSAMEVMFRGDDGKEISSESPSDNIIPEVPSNVLADDMSEASSAPPMCQPLPSGKLMNVRDAVSEVSSVSSGGDDLSESSCPPICEPLPSGKVMNEDFDESSGYEGNSLFIAVEMNDAIAVQGILDIKS